MEIQWLRSDLADRGAKVDRLRSQALGWKQKSLSAVHGCDVIRTHLSQLASTSLRLPSDVPSTASATPPTGKRIRSMEPDLSIKLPRAAKMPQSGTESVATLRPSHLVGPRDSLGLCNPPHCPNLLEHPAFLRDIPDRFVLTSPKPLQDLHGLRRPKVP